MKVWFYVVIALQLLFLIGEAISNQIKLATGNTVILRTAPVDPRSLFTGNYMALSYEISLIDLNKTGFGGYGYSNYQIPSNGAMVPSNGQTIYVGLSQINGVYRPIELLSYLPPPEGRRHGVIYIQGKVKSHWGKIIRVEYGLERYYIPETRQKDVLKMGNLGPAVTVEVSVSITDCTGRIKQILINGKPIGF